MQQGRMNLNAITKGRRVEPFRAVVYGVEGVGKTTFGAHAPDPIFLCAEDGAALFDVARFPEPKTYSDLIDAIRVLYEGDHSFKTIVLDSADWAEQLIARSICEDAKKSSIEEIPYGKGYKMIGEKFALLLDGFAALRARGMNVIILAHSKIVTFDDPTSSAYSVYALATHDKHVTPLLKQWCDALLFADFDKAIKTEGEGFNKRTIAASWGSRVMHCEHRATHDAKNRYGMPATLPFSFAEFWKYYQQAMGVPQQ